MTDIVEYETNCLTCDRPIQLGSWFCDRKVCVKRHLKANPGPIRCGYSDGCDRELETVSEAKAAGWKSIEADAEGSTWNWLGTCPECAKRGDTP